MSFPKEALAVVVETLDDEEAVAAVYAIKDLRSWVANHSGPQKHSLEEWVKELPCRVRGGE